MADVIRTGFGIVKDTVRQCFVRRKKLFNVILKLDFRMDLGPIVCCPNERQEQQQVLKSHCTQQSFQGIEARGPLPADTLFHAAARATYDAALAMYHDQALIPIKTLAFDHAVNVTLGLPFVRTSPDHGTAFDIAGTGRADPSSLIAALRLAQRLSANAPTPAALQQA